MNNSHYITENLMRIINGRHFFFLHYGHENVMKITQKHLHDAKIDIFFMQNICLLNL